MPPPTVSPALTRDLVLSILPPLRNDPSTLRQVTKHIGREVKADVQGSSRMTWPEAERSVAGLARTARVRVQSDMADALEQAIGKLGDHRRIGESSWEGDMPVKMSNLSQHVQFLLALSRQPTSKTHDLAHDFLHRTPSALVDKDKELYDEIMADPFEGDHWGQGYDSEVKEGWTDSDSDSELAISSDSGGPDEVVVTPHRERQLHRTVEAGRPNTSVDDGIGLAEEELRKLRENAYWRTEGGGEKVMPAKVGEGWRALSTGLSVAALAASLPGSPVIETKAITGRQFQRELLFALSGRPGVMLSFNHHGECFTVSDHPTVHHYSPVAVEGILEAFRSRATQVSSIRRYISNTLSPVGSSSLSAPTKTSQAFAEACRVYLTSMEDWVADLELTFVRGTTDRQLISTPLSLRIDLDTRFGTMLDHLSSVLPCANEPIDLLNSLYAVHQSTSPEYKGSMLEVFASTATPLWESFGEWLIKGMPIPRSLIDIESHSDVERKLVPEFWVYRDHDASWTDEDFWDAAFVFRDTRPDWIEPEVLEAALEAGKARGLLRGLLGPGVEDDEEGAWTSLNELLGEGATHTDVAKSIGAYLSPKCQLTTVHLRRVLDEDCGLQAHLNAIDGLFYMRGVDVLQPWTEWLFLQVSTQKRWTDFQLLTSTLRETIEKQGQLWLNPQAARIHATRRGSSSTHVSPTMLSAVRASYRVPFPLSQLFTATSLDLRADVFSFLLQLQFAKHLLDRSRSPSAVTKDKDARRLLHLRHKVIWFINTIWVWLTERVIELDTERYKARLDETSSFGAMIQLELHHTRRIRTFSFQHAKTSAVNDCMASVLELTADVHDLLVVHGQETPQRQPTKSPIDRHVQGRSRRRINRSKRRKADTSSDEDEGDINDGSEDQEIADKTLNADITRPDISVIDRAGELEAQLHQSVSTFIEGIEELARSDGPGDDQADTWAMLSFALQDWTHSSSA